ncbi:hypothetical protein NBRC116493_17020 [Aurantivibrio infirmus]
MIRHSRRIGRSHGFSLVELITVLVIVSALSFVVLPRLRISDSSLLTSRDKIVAALTHAQQIAMARDSASNPITFVVSANSVDVRENGSSVDLPGVDYPLAFANGVSATAGTGTLSYDKLGRTSATVISLNNGQVTITVEASGYAH